MTSNDVEVMLGRLNTSAAEINKLEALDNERIRLRKLFDETDNIKDFQERINKKLLCLGMQLELSYLINNKII